MECNECGQKLKQKTRNRYTTNGEPVCEKCFDKKEVE